MSDIFLVTGAPAAGKSTIARAIAAKAPKSIHIQVDLLREMVVSGVELPDRPWSDETTRQFRLARSSAIHMARLYADAGFTVIIDDVCVPEHFADDYACLANGNPIYKVLLYPSQDATLDRLTKRGERFIEELSNAMPWLYSCMENVSKSDWIVLDSTNWTIDETINQLLESTLSRR
jgi:chloramphenicol 3-O-phosphotransferase